MRWLAAFFVVVGLLCPAAAQGSLSGGSITVYVGPVSIVGDTANVWVDSNGGTCARQSTAGAYSDAAACSTFDAAWDAASSGDVIRVKANASTYGAQTITGNKTSTTQIIGETTGSGVTTGALDASSNFLSLSNVTVNVGTSHNTGFAVSGSDITFDAVNTAGSYVSNSIASATRFTWKNAYLGTPSGKGLERNCTLDDEPLRMQTSTTVVIQNVVFWPQAADITSAPGCGDGTFHLETVRINQDNAGVTIQDVWFKDNDDAGTASIFVTHLSGGDSTNLVFRNILFGSTTGGSYGINIGPAQTACGNIDLAYNTSTGRELATIQCGGSKANVNWYGNLAQRAASAPCDGNFLKNVWQDQQNTPKCGTDTIVIGTRFATDQLGMTSDGHLSSGSSPAVNAAEGTYCTTARPSGLGSVDLDGGTRVASSNCDAGADEWGAP